MTSTTAPASRTYYTYTPEANDAVALVLVVRGERKYVIRHNARNELKSLVDVARPWERSARVIRDDFTSVEEALDWIVGVDNLVLGKLPTVTKTTRVDELKPGNVIEIEDDETEDVYLFTIVDIVPEPGDDPLHFEVTLRFEVSGEEGTETWLADQRVERVVN